MPANRGFTLLELILAVSIVGLVALLALGAFQAGQQAWEKGEAVAQQDQILRIASERIRQQISEAVALAGPGMDNQEIVFRGNSAAMRFISRHSLVPGRRQGLVSVTYRIFDTPDRGKVLGVYEYPLIIQGPRADNGQDAEAFQPLIEGLDEAVWTYRGLLPSGVADWQEDWPTEENQNLPQAVRLTLRPRGELPLRVIVRLADATGGR